MSLTPLLMKSSGAKMFYCFGPSFFIYVFLKFDKNKKLLVGCYCEPGPINKLRIAILRICIGISHKTNYTPGRRQLLKAATGEQVPPI